MDCSGAVWLASRSLVRSVLVCCVSERPDRPVVVCRRVTRFRSVCTGWRGSSALGGNSKEGSCLAGGVRSRKARSCMLRFRRECFGWAGLFRTSPEGRGPVRRVRLAGWREEGSREARSSWRGIVVHCSSRLGSSGLAGSGRRVVVIQGQVCSGTSSSGEAGGSKSVMERNG